MADGTKMGFEDQATTEVIEQYRSRSLFETETLKKWIYGKEQLEWQDEFFSWLEEDERFDHLHNPTLDEERLALHRRHRAFVEWELVYGQGDLSDETRNRFENALDFVAFTYQPDLAVKLGVQHMLFGGTLVTQNDSFCYPAQKLQIVGAYALTELSHGSNANSIRTTATYDPESKEFILNTPDVEAAKVWIGQLGKTATHAQVHAQLYTPDGRCLGPRMFIVEVRDTQTLLPKPGVFVGDMGAKIALNGIDNGYMMLDNVRVPISSTVGFDDDMDEDNADEKVAAELEGDAGSKNLNRYYPLTIGRIYAALHGIYCLHVSLPVAVRYAAVRRQFGPTNTSEELPILEYQLHQYRLIPHICNAYVGGKFLRRFMAKSLAFSLLLTEEKSGETMYTGGFDIESEGEYREQLKDVTDADWGHIFKEGHALSCAAKACFTWLALAGAQEARQACGGHGYLKANRLGEIISTVDVFCTYEGDNNVVIQQASRFLLSSYGNYLTDPTNWPRKYVGIGMKSLDFIHEINQLLKTKFDMRGAGSGLGKMEDLLICLQWLLSFLMRETHVKYSRLLSVGGDRFSAGNRSLVFYQRDLALVWVKYTAAQCFLLELEKAPEELQEVLRRIGTLFCLMVIHENLARFYEGGFMSGGEVATLLREEILDLCELIKADSVCLVDALAPPDFALNSPIGAEDGNVYERLFSTMLAEPEGQSRPNWWKEVIVFDSML